MIPLLKACFFSLVFSFFWGCDSGDPSEEKFLGLSSQSELVSEETPENFKVAFLGDSGKDIGFERVLKLIKKQGAQMIIHAGDFAYGSIFSQRNGSRQWNEKVNQVLGESFPYFLLVGNHESYGWSHYVDIFSKRLEHLPRNTCLVDSEKNDLGVKSYCQYKGIFFLLSGVGSKGEGHESFIEKALSRYQDRPWKVCAWHKNQRSLQLGGKMNEVGWQPYETCQKYGAFIVAGHEHSYGRTKTLDQVAAHQKKEVEEASFDKVELAPGKIFSAVIGTGGKSLRPYDCSRGLLDSWWASIYSTNYVVKNGVPVKAKDCARPDRIDDQMAEYGVLFVTFNHNGEKNKAHGQFVTTSDRILDDFMIDRK